MMIVIGVARGRQRLTPFSRYRTGRPGRTGLAIRDAHHLARIRYLRTEDPSRWTGTLKVAAQASVFVHRYEEDSICQSPPIGSLTSTTIGLSLWLRSVISNSIS